MKKMNDLKLNEDGTIINVVASFNIKRRLMDMGIIKGSVIRPVLINKYMRAYLVKGAVIGIRCIDTKDIEVEV